MLEQVPRSMYPLLPCSFVTLFQWILLLLSPSLTPFLIFKSRASECDNGDVRIRDYLLFSIAILVNSVFLLSN